MNNQSLILLALGAFVAIIVAAAALHQFSLDEHPITDVGGLIWRVDDAYNRIKDLEATLQVTDESQPGEYVRVKVKYVKGPPSVLSMRYVPPEDVNDGLFISSVGNETFIIKNDQLSHYIPSEDVMVSKRWPGLPLVDIGRGFFDISQVESDWLAKKTEIKILQDSGFSEIPSATSLSIVESFSHTAIPFTPFPALEPPADQSYALSFSLCPDIQVVEPQSSMGFAQSMLAGSGSSIQNSHVLEVRDAQSKDLLRMIWIDRKTYLIQKIVTFKDGQRSATITVQLITIDAGLMESDVIAPPQDGVENIRG
jgi:outer membrane lipoprotein-sorting protein